MSSKTDYYKINLEDYINIMEGNFNSMHNGIRNVLKLIKITPSQRDVENILGKGDFCSLNTSYTNLKNLKQTIGNHYNITIF